MYSLHPDKHYALGKLLSKKKQKPAGSLVQGLAQRLYAEQQKRAVNAG